MQRQLGIDFGRVCAVMGVICIHTRPTAAQQAQAWYFVAEQLVRFAVPFFFVAMGYFSRIANGEDRSGGVALRLLGLFAMWFAIYGVLFGYPALANWRQWLDGGDAGAHLWFLTSAAICLPAVSLSFRYLGRRTTLTLAVLLYLGGVAFGAYSDLIFDRDFRGLWDTRDGLTFGAPLIVAGVWIAGAEVRLSLTRAAVLLAIAAAAQVLEAWLVYRVHGAPADGRDFALSTGAFGVAAFLFFQSLPARGAIAALGRLGVLALGIYLIHPMLMLLVQPLYRPDGPAAFALYTLGIFAVSAAIATAFHITPLLRPLVTTTWPKRAASARGRAIAGK